MKNHGVSTVLCAVVCTLSVLTVPAAAQQHLLKLTAQDGGTNDGFGVSVSIAGSMALVGAYQDNDNGTYSGSAYILDATTGQELLKLTPQGGAAYDYFGISVSIAGGLALVGACDDDDKGTDSGSAYIFDASTGLLLHKLTALDGTAHDCFGFAVSVSGNLALVGAYLDDDNGTDSGSAYIFDVTTGQELLKLTPSDGASGDWFGRSVSLSGALALVDAHVDDDNGSNSGSAYLFDATTGQQLLKLTPQDGAANDGFGISVSLSGGLALVGSYGDDDNGERSGSACIFDATTGQQLVKLTAQDGAADDLLGWSVSLSGNLALVGAWRDDDNGLWSGSAYIFDAVTGQQLQKLMAPDGAANDWLGYCCSLSGNLALVGSPWDDDNGNESGSAHVFVVTEPGTGYCFGDPGSGTPCPCNNDNDGSVPGSGCDNGAFSSGAKLVGSGVASVSNDSLVLATTHLEPNNSGLLFQANGDLSPGLVWGDGLRCAGYGLIRLQVRFADAAGTSSTTIAIGAKGCVMAGDTKYYQCWYRTTQNPPCGLFLNDFNTSNGYMVRWLP